MNKKTLATLVLGSLIAFSSSTAFAVDVKSQPGQMLKALVFLQSKGFIIVKKIEFQKDSGIYKANVVNAEGKSLEIKVNAETGEMQKPQEDITGWTAIQIAKKLEDAGYKNIYEINTQLLGHEYDVKVLDEKGNQLSIKVDVESGNITKIAQ